MVFNNVGFSLGINEYMFLIATKIQFPFENKPVEILKKKKVGKTNLGIFCFVFVFHICVTIGSADL